MSSFTLTVEQLQTQTATVRNLLKEHCPTYNIFEKSMGVYHSIDLNGYESIVDSDSKLFIIHPSTGSVYASRVQSKFFDYVNELMENLKAGSSDVYILQNLWKIHPFFLFVTVPTAFQDHAENALKSKYTMVHTAINHNPSEIFQLIEFKHFSGFSWRIVTQKHVDSGPEALHRKVALALRRGALYWNDNNIRPGHGGKPISIPSKFFSITNSTYTVVEEISRKQGNGMKKELNNFNQKNLSDYRGIFSDPEWCRKPAKPDPRVKLILMQSADGIIGFDNNLPEALRSTADIENFAKLTTGNVVIMGRNTWMSLPPQHRPLQGRVNMVVSRNTAPGAASIVHDTIHGAINQALTDYPDKTVFIIGGAMIYKAALEQRLVDEVIVTRTTETVLDKVHPSLRDKVVYFNVDPYVQFPHRVEQIIRGRNDKFDVEVHHCKVNL